MSTPLEVFCCYAREDQAMLIDLKRHLMPMERQGQIRIWSDININAGMNWEEVLHQHLERADIFLLLISPDFIASDYCYGTEMKRAMERHEQGSARVIPVLIRTTFWQDTPLATLQMIPTNAQPITHWSHQDDAFYDIIGHVKRVLVELRSGQPSSNASQNLLVTKGGGQQADEQSSHSLAARPEAIEVHHTLAGHTLSIESVALSADGRTLASGSDDRTITLWNGQTGQLLRVLTDHTKWIGDVALSADGRMLASVSGVTIKLWNTQTGQFLRTLTGHTGTVYSVALSADGRTLASGSHDTTIKLWNMQTGQLLHTLTGHTGAIFSLALSADGRMLASGGGRSTLKIWGVRA